MTEFGEQQLRRNGNCSRATADNSACCQTDACPDASTTLIGAENAEKYRTDLARRETDANGRFGRTAGLGGRRHKLSASTFGFFCQKSVLAALRNLRGCHSDRDFFFVFFRLNSGTMSTSALRRHAILHILNWNCCFANRAFGINFRTYPQIIHKNNAI